MFNWFSRKTGSEEVREEAKKGFDGVKKDMERIGSWISHLNEQDNSLKNQINDLKQDLSSINNEVEQIKDLISMFGDGVSKQLFKTNRQVFNKQTADFGVQTAVQTAVQTGNFHNTHGFSNLSTTERAIIWVLANSELKLSYDDLAAMLGKTRSTIRGQINNIKQKSGGLVEEYVEQNGKKRVYMPEEIKEKILKNVKVKVKKERR